MILSTIISWNINGCHYVSMEKCTSFCHSEIAIGPIFFCGLWVKWTRCQMNWHGAIFLSVDTLKGLVYFSELSDEIRSMVITFLLCEDAR